MSERKITTNLEVSQLSRLTLVASQSVKSLNSREYDELLEVLRLARKSRGIGQEGLSKLVNESPMFTYKIEAKHRRIDVTEFYRVAVALGLDPIELFAQWVERVRSFDSPSPTNEPKGSLIP